MCARGRSRRRWGRGFESTPTPRWRCSRVRRPPHRLSRRRGPSFAEDSRRLASAGLNLLPRWGYCGSETSGVFASIERGKDTLDSKKGGQEEVPVTRERKQELGQAYREWLERSSGVVLTSYSGMSVRALEDLRRKVREAGGEYHVIKNRLMALAMRQAGMDVPAEALEGTTAIGFAGEEGDRLAELPPLPVMRAQLLGLLQTPATRVAGVVAGSVRQIVNVVKAYSETQPAGV